MPRSATARFRRSVTLLSGLVAGVIAAAPHLFAETTPRLNLPQTPSKYAVPLPRHFETPAAKVFDMTPADNPVTDAGAALGRALFYDTRLSVNDSISCGSCHFQEHAFADPRRFSPGHDGVLVDRNSMSLVNLRFMRNGAFWDERGGTLEQQVLMPIESPVEMGHQLPQLVAQLEKDADYPALFQAAFGDERIDSQRIAKALAQFVRSLISYQSKYDEGAAEAESMSEDFSNFSAEENHGKSLFLANCAICHRPARDTQMAHFDLFRSLNNGVDATAEVSDVGRGDVTFDVNQVGLFKPSSLRNVEFTAPYMHDGRFATLEEVVEHYSTGVERNPAVSSNIFRMQFSDAEKRALVAFLKTLSDQQFLTDPKFSDPWIRQGASANQLAPAATLLASSATTAEGKPLTDAECDERIAAGRGLPASDVLGWLRRLDNDNDGKLSRNEYRRVVEILAETEATLRPEELETNQLRRRSRPAPSSAEYPREIVELADFDDDGQLDPGETRRYELFEQFIRLRDGGRLESRLDGILSSFAPMLPQDEFVAARRRLHASKQQLHVQTLALDAELLVQIRKLLTPREFIEFQLAALNDHGNTSGRTGENPTRPDAIEATLQEHFSRFDRNADGLLDDEELHAPARALNELPGGFGQRRGGGATLEQFSRRILAFGAGGNQVRLDELPDRLMAVMTPADVNHDALLTEREVSEFVRNEGFRQIAEHGIYVGGGFEGIFSRVQFDALHLPPSQRDALQSLLRDYADELTRLQDEMIVAAFGTLRSRCVSAVALSLD